MEHPDLTLRHRIIKKDKDRSHVPLYGYQDLAELVGAKMGTVAAAIRMHPEIFSSPDGYITRPPRRAKPMWEKEKFLLMWKLYKESIK